ncbi:MAG TPA: MBL fold metallo-hydrolase [Gaiellaceae bacterium]|jgi:glyoxylase-like metal-dependent hydrolase (beta-lactamase superfamily II)|nr:MBL fold metallo-hydrolase [Gaiellaceae bacterium]
MKTRQITPALTQLTQFHFVNAYLVREDDGFTLVDTTMGNAADAILAAAASAGAPIRRIVLTHGHGDHVGALDALKERLGSAVDVAIPELDARILAGETVVEGKVPGSWPTVRTTPDTRLRAGDRVGSLEVVDAPGHTPGHVAFLDTRDRSLLAGDVFTTYGRTEVSNHFYWRFPFAAMATWDKRIDAETAASLRALEPTVLAAGHGPALRQPGAAIDAALRRA